MNIVLHCSTEEEFNNELSEFRQTYALYSGVIEYLKDNVILLKKYIVNVLTSSVRHLGNTVSSRAEGQHRVVKEYFTSLVGDLLIVVNNLCLSSTNQFREFKQKRFVITTDMMSSLIMYEKKFLHLL